MTIYATLDSCGNRIDPDAYILAFTSEEEARRYLLSSYPEDEYDHATAVISAGHFSDCWLKASEEPALDLDGRLRFRRWTSMPFAADDLIVQPPGSHPGGRKWWITPTPPVLVLEHIEEVEG